jgi:hypothetical protein
MSKELLRYKQDRIYELKYSYKHYLSRLDTILEANIKTIKKSYTLNEYQKTQTINEFVTQYYKDTMNLERALNMNIQYISNLD